MKVHSLKIGLVALCHATIQEKYACELLTKFGCVPHTSPIHCLVIFDLMSSGQTQISFSKLKIAVQDLLQV